MSDVSTRAPRVTEPLVIDAIRQCFDPEIPVNVYELGLIYGITIDAAGAVAIRMTLTAPNCPAAQSLPADVEAKVRALPGVTDVKVEVVFDPPWESCMMSDAAKLQLGML
jgi:FeS assembly SUF system protein